MDIRRNLAMVLTAAVWIAAVSIPALMPAEEMPDPLAPLAPMAPAQALSFDRTPLTPLNQQASAALRALKTGHARNSL